MNVREKCEKLKSDVDKLSVEEKMIRGRLEELKSLISMKKRKLSIIEELKLAEKELLKELEDL